MISLNFKRILVALSFFIPPAAGFGQQADTVQTDTMSAVIEEPFTVIGNRVSRTTTEFPFEKDRFNYILKSQGFDLVRKGTFLAQDVHADGFKRGDITIVIDGERYHSACPNRMDSPLARTNSLEMASIDLSKTSSGVQSGLAGTVAYHRDQLTQSTLVRAGLSQSMAASEAGDIGFSAGARDYRLAGRYATGKGYEDADDRSFVDLYGYGENTSYQLGEVSFTGRRGDLLYRGEFTYTEDIMFPYLMMDERANRVFSGSLSYRKHKAYFNYTDHLMDAGLRQGAMAMETDATNLTLGLTGESYDVYYRRWNADNRIVTPMVSINNHLMPEVNLLAGALYHQEVHGSVVIWGKFGLAYHFIEDKDRIAFHQAVHPEAGDSKTHVTFSLGGKYLYRLHRNLSGAFTADLISEPPPSENLYIAVQRPMGKAWWAGNPTLRAPVRASARSEFHGRGLSLELYGSHVWDYVNLVGRRVDARPYRTYENVDAVFLGFNLSGDWKYLNINAGYTWASTTTDDSALVEIPPLSAAYTLKSPVYRGLSGYLRHTWNNAQTRVDESLNETPTPSWHRLDLGASFKVNSVRFALEVNNVTNELYYQHLSYLRNPYSSGMRVFEPGRTIRLNAILDSGVN